jgi:hypothetical protein
VANQLGLFANDANVRARFRQAGFARAKRFDWSRTARETLTIYASVARNDEKFLSVRR